jgi:hypothetical protein
MSNILNAIEYLPEELFTPAIIEAAINKGGIEVLNHLPEQYLTPVNVLALVEKDKSSWSSFNLGKIPDRLKSEPLCICAVKHNVKNYRYIPENMRTQEISDKIISQIAYHIYLLEYIPAVCWNRENTYTGLNSVYAKPFSYNSRFQGNLAPEQALTLQVLLFHLPGKVKNREFYLGLFSKTSISAQELQALIPNKYKDMEYYLLLAKSNFMLVPEDKHSYQLYLEALNGESRYIYDLLDKKPFQEKFFNCMDDTLADAFVKEAPDRFRKLPAPFQTAQRMLYVIENNPDYSRFDRIIENSDTGILTGEVCRILVKQNSMLPLFPENIWNEEFVQFCMKNTGSFYWFEQMPQQFQTQETVNRVIEERKDYVRCVHPAFINSHLSMKLFRQNENWKEYLPEKYFTDFTQTTGLPERFFGGETTFMKLKNEKKEYTYCQIGNRYIGFHTDGRYSNSAPFIILTQASVGNEHPEVIFKSRVGSFHKTWLEKIIANYDRDFIKPVISKALKEVQVNQYCGVEPAGTKEGIEFFRTTFIGEPVGFTGSKDGKIIHRETKEEVISSFREELKDQEAA